MEYNTYLSDDESNNENDQNIELDQYGMPIIETDEEEELEIRRIINNKMLSLNNLNEDIYYNSDNLLQKKKKESKSSKNKSMSLNDLNNLIDKKIEDKKPKKFTSKRSLNKKKEELILPTIVKESKRQFNPRLIPYLFSDEYKNKKNNSKILCFDNLEFPSL